MTGYNTVKRKAKVGEQILITDALGFETGKTYGNGDVLTVTGIGSLIGNPICGAYDVIVHSEYEVIVDETNDRLSEAEAKIAALEAEVKALKAAKEPAFDAEQFADALANSIGVERRVLKKTPNQRRADVIKRAQAFVADLEERSEHHKPNNDGNKTFNHKRTNLSFHVNTDKGVVTALSHLNGTRMLIGKAVAKCAPDDVFNADIEKAIAAGRLYGVDIPREFFDAPQPTEVVVGMRVSRFNARGRSLGSIKVRNVRRYEYASYTPNTHILNGGNGYCEAYGDHMIEDTDAVYV